MNMMINEHSVPSSSVEEYREGCISTKYAIVKSAYVVLWIERLRSEGLVRGVDYFVLGQGKYRQIHIIQKGEVA